MRLSRIITILLLSFCQGKIPPTPPPCHRDEEDRLWQRQKLSKNRVKALMPPDKLLFTGASVSTIHKICTEVNNLFSYIWIITSQCEARRQSFHPDLIGLKNLCHTKGLYEDYSMVFLCYQHYSKVNRKCYESYQKSRGESKKKMDKERDNCRLLGLLAHCVSKKMKSLCGPEAHSLAPKLVYASVLDSSVCRLGATAEALAAAGANGLSHSSGSHDLRGGELRKISDSERSSGLRSQKHAQRSNAQRRPNSTSCSVLHILCILLSLTILRVQ